MRSIHWTAVLVVAFLSSPALADKHPGTVINGLPLKLEVKAESTSVHVGDRLRITASITNQGTAPVTLIQPGEGSGSQWRTPIVGWSILAANDTKTKHEFLPKPTRAGVCTTVSDIEHGEIFLLAPGATQKLNVFVGSPIFDKAGRYRIALIYKNIPGLQGTAGAKPDVLAKVQASTECMLASNELVVDVAPAPQENPELFNEGLRKTMPAELQAAYARFVRGTKNDDITSSCLPNAVELTREPRQKAKRNYGQDMNLPFLKESFLPTVFSVRKDPDDT